MNMRDLQPASALALRLGCKCVGYGPPGGGKTPLSNTAPRPVMCVTEPGMLSMRNSAIPAFPAFTAKRIDEFFEWFFKSPERKNFDTLILDSVSQAHEIYINAAMHGTSSSGKKVHGQAAYGEANTRMMDILTNLYYLEQCHTYLICKQEAFSDNGTIVKRPYFAGKELPVRIPHLFDIVLRVAPVSFSEGEFTVLQCLPTYDIMARSRAVDKEGKQLLQTYEAFNLSALFNKATQ